MLKVPTMHTVQTEYYIQIGPNHLKQGYPRLIREIAGAGETVSLEKISRECKQCHRGLRRVKTHGNYSNNVLFFSCECFEARMNWWKEAHEFRKLMEKLQCLSV